MQQYRQECTKGHGHVTWWEGGKLGKKKVRESFLLKLVSEPSVQGWIGNEVKKGKDQMHKGTESIVHLKN